MKIQVQQIEKYLDKDQSRLAYDDKEVLLSSVQQYIEEINAPKGMLLSSDTNRRVLSIKELRADRVRSSDKGDRA